MYTPSAAQHQARQLHRRGTGTATHLPPSSPSATVNGQSSHLPRDSEPEANRADHNRMWDADGGMSRELVDQGADKLKEDISMLDAEINALQKQLAALMD